jgi:hypothetical protein
MDCCNPVYEETFEYPFSKPDAYEQSLLFTVKTKKFFHNNTMGQVNNVQIWNSHVSFNLIAGRHQLEVYRLE